MSRTLDANQTRKIGRPYIQPIYLVHLLLTGVTLYFSDRNYYYNSLNYEDYLFDLSDIGIEVNNLGGFNNSEVILKFKNNRFRASSYLIEYFDSYPPEKKYVEIYKLMIDNHETFASDISTKIFKGEMGQPYDIDETGFKINCSTMLFGKNASLPLDEIDLADFANADPDDVGKYRNIIYGNVKKVVCPWTVAGWLSTLTADITAAATSIVVTDSVNAPAVPFTAIIDNEEVSVTVNTTATGTLTVTRASGGTTALIHNKGSQIYEKRADFQAEVAKHAVKAINDIFVKRGDDEWVRVLSGATKHINTGGRAYIVFSDKVKYEEKTNITPSTDTGTHVHTGSSTALVTKNCIPTGASGGTNPTNTIDGSELTYGSVTSGNAMTITFTESNLGTVNKQYVWVYNGSLITGNVTCGGTNLGTIAAGAGWARLVKTGGAWGDDITITGGASGTTIHEVYKEVEYTPAVTVATNPATGVSTTLSGNSVANMIIGDIVGADIEGYQDDGSGTYTGVADALIERPDHVRKHILIALLGFAAADIGTTFGTVGTLYAGQIVGGYKLSFVLHEVATETMELFDQIDLQTRTNMHETGGKFELAFGAILLPTSIITFDEDNIRGSVVFSKSEVADIRNKVRGHYFRDYSKFGSPGDRYQKVSEESDATSIAKYGTMQEDIEFSCVGNLATMVDDVLDWIIIERKELKKIVTLEAFWDAFILENCDYFTVIHSFWSGLLYKTISLIEKTETQTIEIKGLQATDRSSSSSSSSSSSFSSSSSSSSRSSSSSSSA